MEHYCKSLCTEIKDFLHQENKTSIPFETYCKIQGIKTKEAIFTLKKAIYSSKLIGFTYKKINGNCSTIIFINN